MPLFRGMKSIVLNFNQIELTARSIWYEFAVNQSITVDDFIKLNEEVHYRGKLIWDWMVKLDFMDNFDGDKIKGFRRKRTKFKNSTGAPLAQKMFRYKQQGDRFTIWRVQ